MIIGIDVRVLARGTRTGVEEYTINLLSRMLRLDRSSNFKLFYNACRKTDLNYPWLSLENVRLKKFSIPNRLFFITARYGGFPKIDRMLGGLDVYFNPHFFIAPVTSSCRKVMTFHDLSFRRYPEFFSRRKRLWQYFLMNTRREAQRAERVIAVSESTKSDLINIYKIAPSKIKIIYSSVGEQFQLMDLTDDALFQKAEFVRRKYKLPGRFILYFGTIEPRKNLVALIRAFDIMKGKMGSGASETKLVFAGARGWLCKDIFGAARASGHAGDLVFTGFVDEADKPYLYNMAELFVYPSFFEGFGFPPLEAMACGLPVIVSHTSSLPEVTGDAAIMIDPYNIGELAWAMETVLTDDCLKKDMAERGIKRAKNFSWQKCARETLGILKLQFFE